MPFPWINNLLNRLRPQPRPPHPPFRPPVPSRPPVVPPPPAPPPVPPPPQEVGAELLAAQNLERGSRGLGPLADESRLQAAAEGHAGHMASHGQMAHKGIGDGDPGSRAQAQGYPSPFVGENVASGYTDVKAVMVGWMGSPGHRANILNAAYTQCGVAQAEGIGLSPYWCVVFGNPAPSAAPSVVSIDTRQVQQAQERPASWATEEGGRLCTPWHPPVGGDSG